MSFRKQGIAISLRPRRLARQWLNPRHGHGSRHSHRRSHNRAESESHGQNQSQGERRSIVADRAATRRQRGFTLLEVSVVTAVILLLAIVGIPVISNYAIESRVPKAGEELARFIVQTRVNAQGADQAPFQGMSTSLFARSAVESGVFSVAGAGSAARVWHGLGDQGEVLLAEADAGRGFTITLTRVAAAACPAIASVLQRVSTRISVAADGGPATVIKADNQPYNALAAQARCGRSNVFEFMVG